MFRKTSTKYSEIRKLFWSEGLLQVRLAGCVGVYRCRRKEGAIPNECVNKRCWSLPVGSTESVTCNECPVKASLFPGAGGDIIMAGVQEL